LITHGIIALRILFDKNVPIGVRGFLPKHQVRTFVQTGWLHQLENGELLQAAEDAAFDILVTSIRTFDTNKSRWTTAGARGAWL
jgi:hypothetical protein